MRLRSFARPVLPVFLFAVTCVFGCKKESASTVPPAATAATEPAQTSEPPPPPPYRLPDELPVHATVALVKQDGGAGIYKATFDTKFAFDPARAQLALNINTVGWTYHGRVVVTNKSDDDSAGAETHEQLYDSPPTTEKLELPEEHVLLRPKENQWIKDGGITITIRNVEGADSSAAASPPKVLSVDLVEP